MNPEIRQAFQGIGELAGRKDPAVAGVGDPAVLAVNAAEGAAGKEDRAGSAGTGDRRLLPQMRRDPGNPHLLPQTAESGAHRTVGAALPGTQCTDHEQPSDLRRLIIEPERRKIKPVEITGIFRYNIRVKKSTLNAKETKRFG